MKLLILIAFILYAVTCASSEALPDDSNMDFLMDNSELDDVVVNPEPVLDELAQRDKRGGFKTACRMLYFTLPCFIYNQVNYKKNG